MRSPQYDQGRRNGIKACIEWLHEHAVTMNDPHARSVLNSAALCMGIAFRPAPVCVSSSRPIRAAPGSTRQVEQSNGPNP
jgi:hypothetical protein